MNIPRPVRVVERRTRNRLRKEAFLLRQRFGLEQQKSFPIMEFLEHIIPLIDTQFVLEIVEDTNLQGRAAETVPELHLIRVKASVYDAACCGNAWARSVLAHELCHYYLHSDDHVAYAFPSPGEQPSKETDPEWQANVFAAELLAPVHLIDEDIQNAFLVSKQFGVPLHTAKTQLRQSAKVHQRVYKRHQHAKKNSG